MRPSNDVLDAILSGPFQTRIIVDVFYDDQPTYKNLPIADWSLNGDLSAEIPTGGDLNVVYNSDAGQGLSPRQFLDTLAPYGQQVNVLLECSVRGRSETVQIGRYRINKVPEASDSYLRFAGETLVAGSQVQLTIDDLLSGVKRDGIAWPAPPAVQDSTWFELQRLTGLPLSISMDDKPTPVGLIYQPKDGGRLLAVQQLATHLGGIAITNSFGELTVVPFDAPAAILQLGAGQILTPPHSLDSEDLRNHVVGTYQEDDGTPIYAETWVRTGPLAADGPFGRYTIFDSSDTIHTQTEADQRVRDVLALSLAQQTYSVELSCRFNPLVEHGDVVQVNPLVGDPIVGRVVSWKWEKGSTTMDLTLDVARNVPAS